MKRMLVLALILLVAAPLFMLRRSPATAANQIRHSAHDQRILELAARKLGTQVSNLALLRSNRVNLPLTKREATTAKVLHRSRNDIFIITMDANGNEVDLASLRQAEASASQSKYGKLDPFLYDRLQTVRPEEKIKVGFWLNLTEDLDHSSLRDGRMNMTRAEVTQLIATRELQLRQATARATAAIKSNLRGQGFRIDAASLLAPLVYATVPARALTSLAQRADVDRIYFAERPHGEYLNVATKTVNADDVWNDLGFTGTGARVAVVESSRVDFSNSCLALNLGTRVPGDSNVADHPTRVAGIVARNSGFFRGVAPGAGIFSANGTSFSAADMSDALDAGATNADILNNSWGRKCEFADGDLDDHARHADYIVRYLWDTVVVATGNCGDPDKDKDEKGFISGISAGNNVISVGDFDDRNTVSLTDDLMSTTSSFIDPNSPHGDREKPEVAAPGTSIESLVMSNGAVGCPTDSGSGTSFAAPMVSGIAALLMGANPSLTIYPETVKALNMAGATHNIEGDKRLSDIDGAGGVDAKDTVLALSNNQYGWMWVKSEGFDADGFLNVNLGWMPAFTRVKVALAWDSTPAKYTWFGWETWIDPLKADFDLNVVGPGINQWSESYDNSYEMVDFVTPTQGVYTMRIKKTRFDGDVEFLGYAWTKKSTLTFVPK